MMVHKIANVLEIGLATVDGIIYEQLNMLTVCVRWVLRMLVPERKENWVRC